MTAPPVVATATAPAASPSLEAQASGLSAFVLHVERHEAAKVWLARVDGLQGIAATASTLPNLLRQLADAIPELADKHDRSDWYDWEGTSLPYHMRGDFW